MLLANVSVNRPAPFPTSAVAALLGKTLYTLDRKQPFKVVKTYQSGLKLALHTGATQFIYLQALHKAWHLVQTDQEPELPNLDRCNDGLGAGKPAGGTYIATVLAELPNVGYTLEPIRLYRDDGRCPVCGQPMSPGASAPGTVLRCSAFPVCKGTRTVPPG
jgi:hypothetical protein